MALPKERWQAVSPYLDEAMDLGEEARTPWFEQLRDSHPEIAADLQQLLAEQDALREEGFLESTPAMATDQSSLSGQAFGNYTLVSLMGRGGMGSVWLARRSDGRFEGFVAIKLLDTSLAGRGGQERFAREGSFLARLTHPNIAHLIDAGVSSTGQPYLVIERVEGAQIDRYCDDRSLGIEGRIRLFLDVLNAVAHAHANLIVHRDIKPSNVLVSTSGTVKLLDFGIATLLEEDMRARDATALTREGGRALTPAFAAPEQMLGEPVTTATDVYALGVLLYVLLAGRHPTGPPAHSPAHLVKAIVDTVPPRVSDVVTDVNGTTAEGVADAARRRASTPEKLRRTLRGDLDTIVAKALKKQPQARYPSVTAFADDLRRYLANQPISARPDALTYRAAKFVRRHVRAVATAAAIVVLLAGLIAFYTRRLAAERDRAQLEARKSAQVSELLTGLLSGADPFARNPSDITVRGLLDAGAARVEKELVSQPELQAEMLTVLGRVYQRIAVHDRAQALLEKAEATALALWGPEHVRMGEIHNNLGVLLRQKGDYPASARRLESALATRRRLLGAEHPDVAVTLVELGRTHIDRGTPEHAEPLFREALAIRRKALGEEHSETAVSHGDLGLLLWRRGDTAQAESHLRQANAVNRKALGADHPNLASGVNNLGLISMDKRDFAAAASLFREAIEIRTRAKQLGPKHVTNATTYINLAGALWQQGKHDEAAVAAEEGIAIARPVYGDDHPLTATFRVQLARIEVARGNGADAERLGRQALATRTRVYQPDDWRIFQGQNTLGAALTVRRRFAEAERLLLAAHARLKPGPGAEGREARLNAANLVALYEAWGKPDKASQYKEASKRD